jgi:hypothetical protein
MHTERSKRDLRTLPKPCLFSKKKYDGGNHFFTLFIKTIY